MPVSTRAHRQFKLRGMAKSADDHDAAIIGMLNSHMIREHEQRDRPLVVARIAHYAEEVFGDREFAEAWLLRPNPALHDRVPMDVARTEIGARRVEAILSRFEHGEDH